MFKREQGTNFSPHNALYISKIKRLEHLLFGWRFMLVMMKFDFVEFIIVHHFIVVSHILCVIRHSLTLHIMENTVRCAGVGVHVHNQANLLLFSRVKRTNLGSPDPQQRKTDQSVGESEATGLSISLLRAMEDLPRPAGPAHALLLLYIIIVSRGKVEYR